MDEKMSLTKATGIKTVFEAFRILKEEGGQLPGREVIEKIRHRLTFNEWENGTYEKTGYIRWQSIFHFYTIGSIKAGYLRKSKGVWFLTPEGEEAMKKGPTELINSASELYKKWSSNRKNSSKGEGIIETEAGVDVESEQAQKAKLEQLEEDAINGIKDFLKNKNPYEFQDIVAALLRAMGYYTPFISPKGKDGGIDIVAFQDPLGIKTPRIKVQVKHYPENPVPPDVIRSLKGLINAGEEVGLFVTSGRFSSEAQRFAREANIHIKLINGEEFIALWQEFYGKMPDEDKNMLPLQSIYFLGSNE